MNLPKRSLSHKIETESVNHIKHVFGGDWIFRNQEDRDYGIDIHMERFLEGLPTGSVLYGQIKGTACEFDDSVRLSGFPTKTINYAKLFSVPFFLFYASTKSKKTKFIWLQKYAELRIRTHILQGNNTVTIEFPNENTLESGGIEKICNIIEQEKFVKHGFTFITHYRRLSNLIDKLKTGDISVARQCQIQIAAIEISGSLKGYIDFEAIDLLKFDAKEAINIIDHIEKNKLTSGDITNLERSLFPLKLAELEFLNMDINLATCCLINNTAPY